MLSRRKSAARDAARVEHVRRLLRHGARFIAPRREVVESAQWLAGLGIIELREGAAVRCANPDDTDFPPSARDCDGLIDLRDGADEGGRDYRCPECERAVFPEAYDKERYETLSIRLRQDGVEAFLLGRCGQLPPGSSFLGGVLTLPLDGVNGFICVVDYCADEQWFRRGRAASQPCVYITVGPDKASQVLDEDAIVRVELAEILLGTKDLRGVLVDRAGRAPAHLTNFDVPIYGLGTRPIPPAPREQAAPPRVFKLSLCAEGVLIDGLLSIRAGRTVAVAIMGIFMRRFMDAATSGDPVEPMTAKDLANALDPHAERFEDADSIARHIPRLRTSIADTVRRHTGKPIGKHDVIETVSRSGADEDAEGYRLNPRHVVLGPFQP